MVLNLLPFLQQSQRWLNTLLTAMRCSTSFDVRRVVLIPGILHCCNHLSLRCKPLHIIRRSPTTRQLGLIARRHHEVVLHPFSWLMIVCSSAESRALLNELIRLSSRFWLAQPSRRWNFS